MGTFQAVLTFISLFLIAFHEFTKVNLLIMLLILGYDRSLYHQVLMMKMIIAIAIICIIVPFIISSSSVIDIIVIVILFFFISLLLIAL